MAIEYLYTHRPSWPAVAVGKTVVSSSIIDRVVAGIGRQLAEVPVGFKWFVDGSVWRHLGFGGEESAGASGVTDGSVWTTDNRGDGIIMALLAADPGGHRIRCRSSDITRWPASTGLCYADRRSADRGAEFAWPGCRPTR